jgi:hypothetical protein
MHSTLKPKPTDDPHDMVVVAPDVARVAPADQELSNLLHDAARHLSDAQTRAGSGVPAGAAVPPVDTTFRASAVDDVLVPGRLRSIGRGAMRAFAALLLAGCIGAAGIAWQAYGDAAQQMIADWAPQLALTSSLPPEKSALPEQPAQPAVSADAATAAPPQQAPPAQAAAEGVAPAAAAVSAESAQSLQSMARDLATVRQETEQLKASIEQLKASQQQMSREIAKASEAKASEVKASEVKGSEQSLRPRISAPPPRSAAAPARKPMPPPPPPQAAATPVLPQAAAPSAPRQGEPLPQATAQPQAEQSSSVPRPPMPIGPGVGSFSQQ